MLPLATDWTTISSLATGVGTLVLAIATFLSVKSANRSARIAEDALTEQRRPIFTQSRSDDPLQKINFVEGHWVKAGGGRAVAEHVDGVVYLAISLRNVGSGIGVCQRWAVRAGRPGSREFPTHIPEDEFHLQSRDLYIPPGDIGMWQGALRNPHDPIRAQIADAIDAGESIVVELLYSDLVGGQRTVTRLGLTPFDDVWIATIVRHWFLDWSGPRPDQDLDAAAQSVLRDQEEAERERAAAGADGTAGRDGAADRDATAGRDGIVDRDGVASAKDDGQAQKMPAPRRIQDTA
jgi:hypothetical protein